MKPIYIKKKITGTAPTKPTPYYTLALAASPFTPSIPISSMTLFETTTSSAFVTDFKV